MNYSINLFGYNVDCKLIVRNNQLNLEIHEDEQNALKQYLIRVLPRYGRSTSSDSSLHTLLELAIEAEKTLESRISEPKLKLPYEFQPEIKEKLIEAAALQDMSATQLLIRIIEKKYQEVMG
ncbi:hypothetical protein [Paenibacillus caui]|uniref:hypothetical protein n=1 Tax=Paenibacillus caui TaxID=2873927 RepID=UPI001CA8D895|nr:hypothetical protein [Paenibacillus caui]